MPPGSADALAPALGALLAREPQSQAGEQHPIPDGQTESAVLVPIYIAAAEPHVVLTRRRADLRRHAGEISFPGGRREPLDATLADTALREAEEEIGLSQGEVRLAGTLTPTSTFVTNYAIHPFVGAIEAPQAWSVNEAEVDAVIELALRDLRTARGMAQITRRGFTFDTDAYELCGHLIWGATARILDDLIARLAPMLDSDAR
jgi:8-oxo-dGTP pyrophosphatase MutT (NUDIX family)